jgi:predicted amidophosphoribosyltransferase
VAANAYRALASLLVPPRCAICGGATTVAATICAACDRALAAAPSGTVELAGVGTVHWAAAYDGVARELIAGLKFGARLPLAECAAAAIERTLPGRLTVECVVPVPPAPLRLRRRGFDPAHLIAAELASCLGVPLQPVLRRQSGPRQVGRRRADRLESPPRVWATQRHPYPALLVDDVLTTGATLGASARALGDAGCGEVQATVFARALGSGARPA